MRILLILIYDQYPVIETADKAPRFGVFGASLVAFRLLERGTGPMNEEGPRGVLPSL